MTGSATEQAEIPQEFQYLLFFAALSGRGFSKSELGIKLTTSAIDKLVESSGLLDIQRKGSSRIFSANTKTLEWAGTNLNAEMPGKNKAVLAIVHLLRARTHAYLKVNGIAFSAFLQHEPVAAAEMSRNEAVAAVRRAYVSLAADSYGSRVLLKDLRRQLDFDRATQDMAFLELLHSGDADFYSEDDPTSRNAEDEQAALVLADRRRHVMYLHK